MQFKRTLNGVAVAVALAIAFESAWAVGVRKTKPITIYFRKIVSPVDGTQPLTERHIDSLNYHSLICASGAWLPCFWVHPPTPTAWYDARSHRAARDTWAIWPRRGAGIAAEHDR